jgi:hypothetical protein
MKTKLLRKIRKLCLIKYTSDNSKYHKELVLFNKKKNTIQRNKYEPIYSPPDLAFVLDELKQTKLLKQYWAKKAYKVFKRL